MRWAKWGVLVVDSLARWAAAGCAEDQRAFVWARSRAEL